MKYFIKINFLLCIFNVATRKFRIMYVACVCGWYCISLGLADFELSVRVSGPPSTLPLERTSPCSSLKPPEPWVRGENVSEFLLVSPSLNIQPYPGA